MPNCIVNFLSFAWNVHRYQELTQKPHSKGEFTEKQTINMKKPKKKPKSKIKKNVEKKPNASIP